MNMMKIVKPKVPYVGEIKGGIYSGMQVIITGIIPPTPNSFTITFACSSSPSCDHVALEFMANFKDKVVNRNSMSNRLWGQVETHGGFTFMEQESFILSFAISDYKYRICINGRHFADFEHRIPISKVTTLTADGNVLLSMICVEPETQFTASSSSSLTNSSSSNNSFYPPAQPPPYPGLEPEKQVLFNLSIPAILEINGGMYPGKTVIISGKPTAKPQRFHINFEWGSSTNSGKANTIALHFNPRFHKKREVVRNSFYNGAWGVEEVESPCFPFAPELYFDITIKCMEKFFQVIVDGMPLVKYIHRFTPLSNISQLVIAGDVIITLVAITSTNN